MADEENAESPEQKADEPGAAEELPAEEALAEDAATEADEQPEPPADTVEEEPQPAVDQEPQTAVEQEPQPAEDPDTPGSEAEDVSGGDSTEASGGDSEDVSGGGSEEAPDPEVALAADAAAEGEEPKAGEPKAGAKGSDLPPGADLEPIAVEPDAPLSAEEKARLEAEMEERASREAELEGEGAEESAASRAPAQMESGSRFAATGKRKRSIARVILTPGEGRIEVNERTLEEYFPRPLHQTMARQPLASAGYEDSVDVRIRVHGGGISGQAGAVRHGIARALTEIDSELRGDLKRRGFLTRDARVKERRKAGLKKARKKPQFSKR
ncbi:MAG: 30S ribosomal protein S9 [Solirubrobacterales bacterium]